MMSRIFRNLIISLMLLTLLAAGFAAGQDRFNEDLLKNFNFRNLGPYRAGSWVTSFAVPAAPLKEHLYTFYVGTRNGGVWKTVPPVRKDAVFTLAPSAVRSGWVWQSLQWAKAFTMYDPTPTLRFDCSP
jgi:hypothetical protein